MATEPNLMARWTDAAPAAHTARVLRRLCSEEAQALLHQGFLVPAPAVLAVAAERFEALQQQPFERSVAGFDPTELVDAWRMLAVHWHALEDAIELDWSSYWAMHRQVVEPDIALAARIEQEFYTPPRREEWAVRAARDFNDYQAERR